MARIVETSSIRTESQCFLLQRDDYSGALKTYVRQQWNLFLCFVCLNNCLLQNNKNYVI